MTDDFLDRNLESLLGLPARPADVDPAFKDALRSKLLASGRRATRLPAAQAGRRLAPGVPSWAARWSVAAAAAVVVVVVGLELERRVDCALYSGTPVVAARPEIPRDAVLGVPADRALVASVARDAVGGISLRRGDVELARLELLDGGTVEFRPDFVPLLAVQEGLVRLEARVRVHVRSGPVEVDVSEGSDCEFQVFRQGESVMMRNWLIPGGAGAVAGAAIVLLVRSGLVETKDKDGVLRPVPPDEPLVVEVPATRPLEDDDAARRLARAERRIAELEKRLNAAHEESAKLGAELVQKKGITLADLAARFEELKGGTGMTAFLPGKTAGLIADLKGLGPAGTQALVDLLKSKDKDDRTIAAKLLEDLKDPAAIPALKDVALNDEDELAAKMAGHAIALMEDPRAIEPLREILDKKRSWESEVNALWGLVHLGDQRGLEQAIAYMDDGKVGKQPRAALGANVAVFMPYPEVMPIVDATVRDFFASGHVMEIAINYYKAVGNAPARDRLQAISTDARLDAETREAARQALMR